MQDVGELHTNSAACAFVEVDHIRSVASLEADRRARLLEEYAAPFTLLLCPV